MRGRLDNTLQLPLWREVGGGELRLYVRRRELFRRRDGSEGERWVDDRTRYAAIRGASLLDPSSQQFAPRLKTAAEKLASIRFDDHAKAVAEMTDSQRTATAKTLARSMDRATNVFDGLDEARRFASPITVATLRNWALREGSPFPLYIARVDADFYIGRSEEQKLHIPIAPPFDDPLPTLPSLGNAEV